ncbi:MAG: creatininase family protein [Kiritimatiellia bacterium]
MHPFYSFSAPALRERLSEPGHIVLIPLGAIEQHGPHLPVGTDSLIGSLLLRGISDSLGSGFPLTVTPGLPFSKSNEHTGFPGTLQLRKSTLIPLLEAWLDNLEDCGASCFAFLNTHGGNTAWLRTLLRERACHSPAAYHVLNPMPETGMDERECTFGIHAGEYESSLLYAALPGFCKPELADCQWIDRDLTHPEIRPEFAPVTFAWVTSDLSPSGTMGDATRATAEKGEKWIREAVRSLCGQLEDLRQ